jgi:hypothetical protein
MKKIFVTILGLLVYSHFSLARGSMNESKWMVFSKIKNKVQTSEFFSIEYLGSEDRTPKHVTATLFVESYAVIDNATHTKQVIEVRSGQLPPKPQQFQVAGKHFTLGTFKTPDGARLSPDQFIITSP